MPPRCPPSLRSPEQRDRKSTRLNSSHSQISYPVFCLKKKNDRKVVAEQKPESVRRQPQLFGDTLVADAPDPQDHFIAASPGALVCFGQDRFCARTVRN